MAHPLPTALRAAAVQGDILVTVVLGASTLVRALRAAEAAEAAEARILDLITAASRMAAEAAAELVFWGLAQTVLVAQLETEQRMEAAAVLVAQQAETDATQGIPAERVGRTAAAAVKETMRSMAQLAQSVLSGPETPVLSPARTLERHK